MVARIVIATARKSVLAVEPTMAVKDYRWKATRSPSSEILSWLLTRGELVLS